MTTRDAMTEEIVAGDARMKTSAESSFILPLRVRLKTDATRAAMQFRRFCLWIFLILLMFPSRYAAPLAQGKTACDLISIADIEAIVGRKMFLRPTRPQLPENCYYSTADPFDNRPAQPVINVSVQYHHESTPDPEAYDNAARILRQQRGVTVDPIQGLGDAAFGFGNDLAGDVYVFRGGVDTLHISGTLTVDRLKPLALKALGGSGRTGYAYGGTRPGAPPSPTVTAVDTPVVGGSSLSEAVYITPSEFLKQLKEVSLEISNNVKAVSAATARAYVTKTLAARGITVRDGAPVTLAANLKELKPAQGDTYQIHSLYATLEFYTRVVVIRSGKAHLVMAAPARGFAQQFYIEANGANKFVFGDHTWRDLNDMVAGLIDANLDEIDGNNAIDSVAWPVKTWTASQKTGADAEFARLMSAAAVDKDVTDGINRAPLLELVQPATDNPDNVCPTPKNWRGLWNNVFQNQEWTINPPQEDLALRHTFFCGWQHYGPGFFGIAEDIEFRQSNGVFAMNGRIFRKPVTLLTSQNVGYLNREEDTLAMKIDALVQDDLMGFGEMYLDFGISSARAMPPAPLRIAAGIASPDNPAARIGAHKMDAWERRWEAPFIPAAQYTPAQARRGRMILKGTVSRVALEGNFPQRLRIFFKESPDGSVGVCTPSPDIFVEFGTGYQGLIGRTLEAAGDVQSNCGIFVAQSSQFRVLSTQTYVP